MKRFLTLVSLAAMLAACAPKGAVDVIFDTDANNELDDQHAIAYLLMNPETFNVLGITTNNTRNGGGIAGQSEEARRIVTLMGRYGRGVQVIDGAEGSYEAIKGTIANADFDGHQAVDFIISTARKYSPDAKLTLLAVGKLTNVALAVQKAPEIIPNIRLVWLGSNYPEPGEYNLKDDIPSMNYVLDSGIQFEIATVSYGRGTGTDAVRVTKDFAHEQFAGQGPKIKTPVVGRHGGEFHCFGDYSVNLFDHIKLGEGKTRALFDMAACAIVKNPEWAEKHTIPAPLMIDGQWVGRPDNKNTVVLWENFDRDAIVNDFVRTLRGGAASK